MQAIQLKAFGEAELFDVSDIEAPCRKIQRPCRKRLAWSPYHDESAGPESAVYR